MKKLKILLVGQPNVGKSSLLNALTGPIAVVSNYPGTTVEITRAKKVFGETEINFIDTPGIYSISDRSEEEKVAKRALIKEKADGVVVVADAVSLERSLYLILQIIEARMPVIIALNFVEEAEKKGIKNNCERLKKLLNVPIVSINPLTKKGISKFIEIVLRISTWDNFMPDGQDSLNKKRKIKSFKIKYSDRMEKAINEISNQISSVEERLPKRFIALRILEKDEDFYRYLKSKIGASAYPGISQDISIARYDTALFITKRVGLASPNKKFFRLASVQRKASKKEREFYERLDKIILHRIWGPPVTGLFLLAVFGILLWLGNLAQSVLMSWTEFLLSFLNLGNSITAVMAKQGIVGVMAGISIALPYVFLFYLLLGLLEDVGLLSRFIVNAERFLGKVSLSGKASVPLMLGLGCSVSAIRATRVLSSKKEQFYAASLLAFTPCSSRIAILMGVVGFYGGLRLAFFSIAVLLASGIIWALALKRIFQIKKEPLLLELPPYRKPLIKNILVKSWIRMKSFVYVVIPLLILGGMAYGVLDKLGFTDIIVKPFSPITTWLGLPEVTIIPLVFGFLQKDLTGAMLVSALGADISLALTSSQLFTFGIASTIGIPCVVASGMLAKEFGFKKAAALTIISIAYGFLLAGLIGKLLLLF